MVPPARIQELEANGELNMAVAIEGAGNFRISIVGKLKDGEINQAMLASYRKQMKAALEGSGETAERN